MRRLVALAALLPIAAAAAPADYRCEDGRVLKLTSTPFTAHVELGEQRWSLQRVRQELKARQALAARTFRGQARAHPHGLHVWLALPPRFDQYRLIQTALEQGLGVANSDAFSVDESAPDAIRVSLGGATDQAGLQVALEKLAEILATDRPQRTVIV